MQGLGLLLGLHVYLRLVLDLGLLLGLALRYNL
jgi:hypothetical protein